jgi:uncharacterized protein (DUF983 family)
MSEEYNPTTVPALTGIKGLCPRCQRGHLFRGLLKLAPQCEVCGLDFSFADPADGPAFFAMSIVAVPALAFALWLQFTYEPSLLVHLIVTVPLTLVVSLILLRPLKGWLVCSQYFHKAEQGSIDYEWHRLAAEQKRSRTDQERTAGQGRLVDKSD